MSGERESASETPSLENGVEPDRPAQATGKYMQPVLRVSALPFDKTPRSDGTESLNFGNRDGNLSRSLASSRLDLRYIWTRSLKL